MVNIINDSNTQLSFIIYNDNWVHFNIFLKELIKLNPLIVKFYILHNKKLDKNDQSYCELKNYNFEIIDIDIKYKDILKQVHFESFLPYIFIFPCYYIPDKFEFQTIFQPTFDLFKLHQNVRLIRFKSNNNLQDGYSLNLQNLKSDECISETFVFSSLIEKEQITEETKKTLHRYPDVNMMHNVSVFIRYILNQKYICKNDRGENFYLIFTSISRCIDDKQNDGDVIFYESKAYIKWNTGRYKGQESTLHFSNGFGKVQGFFPNGLSFTGMKGIEDVLKSINTTFISFVIAAYKIEDSRIENFIGHNLQIFLKTLGEENFEIIIVTDKDSTYLNSCKNCKIIKYPVDQNIFSIGKTINYGIRNTSLKGNSIIIKSDIDILFSNDLLIHMKKFVINDYGYVGVYSRVPDWSIIADVDNLSKWKRREKITYGYGACFALTRHDWFVLKGYDERIEGWGGDDNDMLRRSRKKLKKVEVNGHRPLYHIEHPARTNNNYFYVNSTKNLQISSALDWNNDNWGIV